MSSTMSHSNGNKEVEGIHSLLLESQAVQMEHFRLKNDFGFCSSIKTTPNLNSFLCFRLKETANLSLMDFCTLLANLADLRVFRDQMVFYHSGNSIDSFYLVLEGELSCFRQLSHQEINKATKSSLERVEE